MRRHFPSPNLTRVKSAGVGWVKPTHSNIHKILTHFFLPDLTRVKSGRACHPARLRGGRSSGQRSTGPLLIPHHPPASAFRTYPGSRAPIYRPRHPAQPPLPHGLAPSGNGPGSFPLECRLIGPGSPAHNFRPLPARAPCRLALHWMELICSPRVRHQVALNCCHRINSSTEPPRQRRHTKRPSIPWQATFHKGGYHG
jgi:hypothetical protein